MLMIYLLSHMEFGCDVTDCFVFVENRLALAPTICIWISPPVTACSADVVSVPLRKSFPLCGRVLYGQSWLRTASTSSTTDRLFWSRCRKPRICLLIRWHRKTETMHISAVFPSP